MCKFENLKMRYLNSEMNIKKYIFLALLIFMIFNVHAQQEQFKSIHQSQSEYYQNLGLKTISEFDSINNFSRN